MPPEKKVSTNLLTYTAIKTIISLVGRSGAIAALTYSENTHTKDLRDFATEIGISILSKTPKKQVAQQIVRHVDKRILKSLDELQLMSAQQISAYLKSSGCDAEEVIELLQKIELKTTSKRSTESLIDFAAVQISSLGVFHRLSEGVNKEAD